MFEKNVTFLGHERELRCIFRLNLSEMLRKCRKNRIINARVLSMIIIQLLAVSIVINVPFKIPEKM